MNVGVRFVQSPVIGIKEHILIHMNMVEYMKHHGQLIEINEGRDAIAIFQPTEEGYELENVYDAVKHEIGYRDYASIEYKRKFPNRQQKKPYQKEFRVGSEPNGGQS